MGEGVAQFAGVKLEGRGDERPCDRPLLASGGGPWFPLLPSLSLGRPRRLDTQHWKANPGAPLGSIRLTEQARSRVARRNAGFVDLIEPRSRALGTDLAPARYEGRGPEAYTATIERYMRTLGKYL